jgi:hypothetical protein
MMRHLSNLLWALLLAVALPAAARAQGTPYVPMLDPAYEDLDALIGSGLVRDLFVGERPYSQASFRRFVQEASRRGAGLTLTARESEAIARLETRFGAAALPGTTLRRTPITGTVAIASSPTRAMRVNGFAPGIALDADLNLLLQRNQGRVLLDGFTSAVEGGFTVQRGHFAAEVTPRVWAGLPSAKPADTGLDLVAGYARGVWGPVALDLGRSAYVVGFGPYGGAMQSTNARALDQARLRAERPVRLPGVLRHLGLWQASLAIATLGPNRDNANGTLVSMRLSGRPSRYVEWGISYENQHSGEGAPFSYQYQRLQEMFLPFRKSGWVYAVTDRVVGAEMRIAVPQTRSALYANFLTTDERYRFSMKAGGYWEDAVWVGGFEQRGLGRDGRLDLRLEGRHSGPIPHSHHQFTSGMTVDRRTFGDAMGPNSEGVALTGTWNGRESRLSVEAAMERYSIDNYDMFKSPSPRLSWDEDWRRVTNLPKELRQRVMLNWLQYRGWRGYESSLRLGYERIVRFNWTDRTRHAAVLEWSLRALP